MEYLLSRLLREAARFLEICQVNKYNGKLNEAVYHSLTDLKFMFIKNVMSDEKAKLYIDSELLGRLIKLCENDRNICKCCRISSRQAYLTAETHVTEAHQENINAW